MLGRSIGLSKEKVENVLQWRTSDVYTDIEKVVLEYSEAVVKEIRISDDLYQRLSAYFTPQQILVLCITSGISGMINRVHGTFMTEVEDTTNHHEVVQESVEKFMK
jgi:4-carboxymuconolactone decarboxylase